jgi:two-component system sensor histidine kinase ChvG
VGEKVDKSSAAQPARRIVRRRFSPLIRRILLLNMLAPVFLAFGVLYLDDYRQNLIAGEFGALTTQGEIFAAALGASAVEDGPEPLNDEGAPAPPEPERLSRELSPQILRRLVEPARLRARLFSIGGELIADTQVLGAAGAAVEMAPLPPLGPQPDATEAVINAVYDFVVNWLPSREVLPPDSGAAGMSLAAHPEAEAALRGEVGRALRARPTASSSGQMTLTVAVPVQRFKQVLGVLLLTTDSRAIEANLRSVRLDILQVFVAALLVTVLISLYLGRTLAAPIRRLALAAEHVRRGGQVIGAGIRARALTAGRPAIPDLSARNDEIGDLSVALSEMTEALWRRLDAIERFAADVAHEIKNPLTSLKSAVETASRVEDPVRQRRLLTVILDDVSRLDRLISDISDASRLDAELSREETRPVNLAALLRTLVDIHSASDRPGAPRLTLEFGGTASLVVQGLEDRLGQVFRNLIANAVSFSPPNGRIRLIAARRGGDVEVAVEDEGPGMPEDRLEKIFERFYSERPQGEKFGTHSGLGLSISRQIVIAHGGRITAENRRGADGAVVGARFVVRLPAS